MTEDFISLQSIRKSYGPVVAVDNVDLQIAQGTFFSLLGPSGCGKTTLLSLLGGLDVPTSGKIFIDGADVTTTPSYRRPTNMVFQSYAIFPHLNISQNVAYGLRRMGLSRQEITQRVGRMLELVRLDGFGDRKPDQISGGQAQRVALARALVMQPKVLLLDEPLSALDKRLRQSMQIELRAIQREVGITFVFVTHDQEEALTLSDRIAVMARGQVLQCSSPAELYDHPVSYEVADFVGEMNFLPAVVQSSREGETRVSIPSLGEHTLTGAHPRYRKGDAVRVAVRPENIDLTAANGGPSFRIADRAYFGSRVHFILNGDGTPITAALHSTAARKLDSLCAGDAVSVSFDSETAIILPA